MPNYRIYRIVDSRGVGIPEYVQRDSDQDIIEYAKKMLNGRDIQVLDGPRVVVKLKSTAAKKPTAFPMPGLNQTPLTRMTFWACPKCQKPIRLVLIQPAEPDHEKRTFRCNSCGHSETRTVKFR